MNSLSTIHQNVLSFLTDIFPQYSFSLDYSKRDISPFITKPHICIYTKSLTAYSVAMNDYIGNDINNNPIYSKLAKLSLGITVYTPASIKSSLPSEILMTMMSKLISHPEFCFEEFISEKTQYSQKYEAFTLESTGICKVFISDTMRVSL